MLPRVTCTTGTYTYTYKPYFSHYGPSVWNKLTDVTSATIVPSFNSSGLRESDLNYNYTFPCYVSLFFTKSLHEKYCSWYKLTGNVCAQVVKSRHMIFLFSQADHTPLCVQVCAFQCIFPWCVCMHKLYGEQCGVT